MPASKSGETILATAGQELARLGAADGWRTSDYEKAGRIDMNMLRAKNGTIGFVALARCANVLGYDVAVTFTPKAK